MSLPRPNQPTIPTTPQSTRSEAVPGWFVLGVLIALAANALASFTTTVTIDLMRGVSDFALAVRAHDLTILPYYRAIAFPAATAAITWYLWPIIAYFRCGTDRQAPAIVERRVISAPLVTAVVGFTPWLAGALLFPLLTLHRFGRWSGELASQQVLSTLVNGFLAATTTYLLLDWVFRARVVPRVFPRGRLSEVPGSAALGVRARLLVFLIAVAFTPLFTVLGLVRAAAVRVESGIEAQSVVAALTAASQVTFVVYVALGIALTLLVAGTLTRPLAAVVAALRRIQTGDLDVAVQVTASDEVGVLEDGVNAMAAALREKERILCTFGHIVEPAVRDHLLAGDLRLGGELRRASVLFCDLRGFTSLAERMPPSEVVATLNEFFSAVTAWVRECGGFVDKFIGDAVLVVFGLFETATAAERAAAAAALRCALGMQGQLAELNARRTEAGYQPLSVSIGIHSGELLAGTIGASDRHEYTVIGDTVNVAARVQQLCKTEGCRLMLTESTRQLAEAHGCTLAEATPDTVQLRGRDEPIRVFRVA